MPWWVDTDRFCCTGGQDLLHLQRKRCSVSPCLCCIMACTVRNQWHCHFSYLAAGDHTESRKQAKVTRCGMPCHWLSSFHASQLCLCSLCQGSVSAEKVLGSHHCVCTVVFVPVCISFLAQGSQSGLLQGPTELLFA